MFQYGFIYLQIKFLFPIWWEYNIIFPAAFPCFFVNYTMETIVEKRQWVWDYPNKQFYEKGYPFPGKGVSLP